MNNCVVKEQTFGIRTMQYVAMTLRGLYHYICLLAAAIENQVHKEKMIASDTVHQKAEQLLNEYGNSVLRMAYSYLHNMSDAEDVLQDTLLQYLKTAPVLENGSHEKAWLLRVAANLSKNRIKYNSFRKTDELDETLVAEQREDLSFVWEAVKELPFPNLLRIIMMLPRNLCCREVILLQCRHQENWQIQLVLRLRR